MLRTSARSLIAMAAGALCCLSSNAYAQPAGTGACCVRADGAINCRIATPQQCFTARGAFRGPGTTCDPNPCTPPPPPTGACCTRGDDGPVCTVGTAAACRRAQGRYRGNGTTCEPNPCVPPPARGACCIPGSDSTNPRCAIITQANCTEAGGTYGGDNVTCRAADCPTACACDINRNGVLDLADLFAFLNDHMAGDADFDGDNDTDADDLSAFVTCFQTAPTGCIRAGRGPG